MSRFSYHIPILGYHRVGPYRGDHVPTVSAEAFARQLAVLARRRYRVLELDDVVASLEGSAPPLRKSVVITFDDGYQETYDIAWPLLKRFGFPAIVFVTPAEVGLAGFASWSQLSEMAQDSVMVGCHTMHHTYIPHVKVERLTEELVDSKRVIEERLGRPIHFLSYPMGGFTPQAKSVVEQAGYRAACTTNRAATLNWVDRFALRRIKVTERDANPLLFSAKLSGYYDLFRQLRDPC